MPLFRACAGHCPSRWGVRLKTCGGQRWKEREPCEEFCFTLPVISESKSVTIRPSSALPTRLSACRQPVCAARICGPTAGSVRRFLPDLIDMIWNRIIDPGKVFDLELPLDQAAAGYQAMDERRAIKVLLRP